jgi:serine O-acetyltransferase
MLSRVRADYQAFSAHRGEGRTRARLLLVPRFLLNPELHAVVLVRLAAEGPRWSHWLWRNLLVAKHGMDVGHGARIGPGLMLPHPVGVVIGPQVTVGERAVIYHGVTIGGNVGQTGTATVGDRVVIWPNAMIVGTITVGADATIGAGTFVDVDVAANGVVGRGVRDARPEHMTRL